MRAGATLDGNVLHEDAVADIVKPEERMIYLGMVAITGEGRGGEAIGDQ